MYQPGLSVCFLCYAKNHDPFIILISRYVCFEPIQR